MRLRYQLPIPNLQIQCSCGEKYAQYTMLCKNGGFVTLRHNKLRDVTGALLEEICHDVLPSNQSYDQLLILYHQQQTRRSQASCWCKKLQDHGSESIF